MKILRHYGAARLYTKVTMRQTVRYFVSVKENGLLRRVVIDESDEFKKLLDVLDNDFEDTARSYLNRQKQMGSHSYYEVKI